HHGKTYVVNYGTSRYALSANITLRHGASLQYECDPGYMLIGNRGSTCFSGIWRPDQIPVCNEGILFYFSFCLTSMSII
ncbi:unnamed protein product, partial [Adineta steineri]